MIDLKALASEAFNLAVKHIQDKLAIKTGDFAGAYFMDGSGERMFECYIAAELANRGELGWWPNGMTGTERAEAHRKSEHARVRAEVDAASKRQPIPLVEPKTIHGVAIGPDGKPVQIEAVEQSPGQYIATPVELTMPKPVLPALIAPSMCPNGCGINLVDVVRDGYLGHVCGKALPEDRYVDCEELANKLADAAAVEATGPKKPIEIAEESLHVVACEYAADELDSDDLRAMALRYAAAWLKNEGSDPAIVEELEAAAHNMES